MEMNDETHLTKSSNTVGDAVLLQTGITQVKDNVIVSNRAQKKTKTKRKRCFVRVLKHLVWFVPVPHEI